MDKPIKYADRRNALGRYLQAILSPHLAEEDIGIVHGDMCLRVETKHLVKSRRAPMPQGYYLARN